MTTLVIAAGRDLLIARRGARWTVEHHLRGASPESLAADPMDLRRIYAGTMGNGLWRSEDGGRTWTRVGTSIAQAVVTAVAASSTEQDVVYAGTEPSAVYRSDDAGGTWRELTGLRSLPSASSWSFPPRPDTHHVRWIQADPGAAGRVFVAIEAGALVRTEDGGRSWVDRVRGGPIDTHTAATHPLAPGRVYSAAGDGYFESRDAGRSWTRLVDGLRHRYLVGVAVDPADPEVVVVSAAPGPWAAYQPENAEAYVYRKSGGGPFIPAMQGLPDGRGTVAGRLAAHPGEPGAMYSANNHGVFRSGDGGATWQILDIPWPRTAFAGGVDALIVLPA